MTPDWDSDTVEYYFEKKPNIVFGSPAVLELTLKFLPDYVDLSQMSHFISGGDFLTEEHARRAYAFWAKHNNTNIELGNGCGNAETVSIGSTPVGVPLKQSTAGKILVGTTPLIIDKDKARHGCPALGVLVRRPAKHLLLCWPSLMIGSFFTEKINSPLTNLLPTFLSWEL